MKKGILWGGIITVGFLVISVLHGLFSRATVLAGGRHGHGFGYGHGLGPKSGGYLGMGHHGVGFGEPFMMGPQHQGLSWLWSLVILAIVIAVLVFIVKALRKKSKASAMQQFIHTSLMSQQSPRMNQNANLLDQWERNIMSQKENE
jgi:uncharacterized membrane protein